jgi:hypothetical protein
VTRTTIDIAEPVLRELKARQRREGRTLGDLASELLAQAMAEGVLAAEPLHWLSRGGTPSTAATPTGSARGPATRWRRS